VGDGALWLEKKKSPLIGGQALQVRGEWEQIGMETRLTVTFPPYLYRRLPWPGYTIKSTEWLALSRYKKYGQKERGEKNEQG